MSENCTGHRARPRSVLSFRHRLACSLSDIVSGLHITSNELRLPLSLAHLPPFSRTLFSNGVPRYHATPTDELAPLDLFDTSSPEYTPHFTLCPTTRVFLFAGQVWFRFGSS